MAIQQDNTFGNLAGILQAIPGLSEAINGQTSTSQTSISNQGLNYLLQQILSSNQGLASVASGQNTAGMYNSTVQTQMVNDLLARSAGEVASKNATTTTTKQPTLNLGDTLLQGAAGVIGSKILSKGVNALSGSVMDALGLGATTTAGGEAAGSALLSSTTGTIPGFSIGSTVPTAVANASMAGAAGSAGGAGAVGSGVGSGAADAGIASAIGDTGAGAIGAGLGAGIGAAGTAGAVGAATAGGMAAGGAALSGLGGAVAGDVAASTAGIAAAEGVGAGVADAAASGGIMDAIATIAPALAWVVCTELETQGIMSHELYTKAAPDFISRQRLKPSAVRGYHFWAVPYTTLMRRKDWIGRLARLAIKPLALGRSRHIIGEWNIIGWITFNILEPICSLIGNTIARKPQNWKKLYQSKTEEK